MYYLFSGKSIYLLLLDRAPPAHVNYDNDHLSSTTFIFDKRYFVEYARKFSIDVMSSPNIPGLGIMLSKTSAFPTVN